ncbi:MAG: PLP-dependent aminotransferase family protein [Paracoccaceae bacterium]
MDTMLRDDLITTLTRAIKGAGRAKYQGLAQGLRTAIADDLLETGEKLPAVRELAWRVGVTPNTVARAYTILTDEGRLTAGVGRGTFVADAAPAVGIVSTQIATTPPPKPDWPAVADLRSPKLPDLGQGDLLRAGLVHIAQTAPIEHLLRYPSRLTDEAARQAFRHWVSNAPVGSFTEDDVVIAHGGQSAIVMILQTILEGAEPVILVDDLTYSGYRRAAELVRARTVSVPWDAHGPDPKVLERLAIKHKAQIFCTSAEVCNPIALTTQPQRRAEIAEVAKRIGLHVLDDDCYRTGPHRGESYRALLPDLGWYVTSPSKAITPALRIGFALPPNGWGNSLSRVAVHTSFGVARTVTDLFAAVVNDPQLPTIAAAIRDRINDDLRIALNHLGGHAVNWLPDVPFLWVELPRGWRAQTFCREAEGRGVVLKSADEFAPREGRAVHAVRIAVNGQIAPGRFEQAMADLRHLLDNPPESISV